MQEPMTLDEALADKPMTAYDRCMAMRQQLLAELYQSTRLLREIRAHGYGSHNGVDVEEQILANDKLVRDKGAVRKEARE